MKIAGMLPAGLMLWLLAAGCNRPTDAEPGASASPTSSGSPASLASKSPAERTANEVLQQLLATYRQAKTYQDDAVVRLAFKQGGQQISEQQPAAVAFERPGKLSIVAYQATVKCDGKELKARIDDPLTKNVDGQIVVRPLPRPITLADLASDRLLSETLSSRLRRQPIQLELLLESGGLIAAFSSDVACRRLSDATHDGRTCFRVEVPSPGGPFIFWVDQTAFLLRRLDYPAPALWPELANDPSVSQIELYADLREAKIGASIPASQFALEVPANAKQMKRFAVPPPPLPSDLFGQQPREFFFTQLDGSRRSEKDLAGKISVLAWYHDNPACEATLQQVSAARQRLGASGDIVFLAVATDPTTTSNEALQRRLSAWKVELPIVRDLEAFGDKSFHIEVQPTLVILDKRGCVQIFQPGGNPELADQIVTTVERLKRGDDLAAEIIADYTRERQKYEQLLARGGPEPDELLELPEAVIRRKSEPKTLAIKPLWTNAELKSPGNIVVAETPNQTTRIFVFEGPRAIAQIDSDGQIVTRHALDIPPQAAVTFARTARDKTGQRYFLASAPLARQLFLFDGDWKLLLAYPPADHAPLDVVDLALIDLDQADGIPEILVASSHGAGVVALSLTGELRWRNRTVPNALSVAASPPDEVGSWGIFVAGEEKGAVLRLNRFGHEEPPVTVANWPIGRIFSGPFTGENRAALLGFSNNAKLEPFAVGLTDKLAERWNYPLPPGVHQQPIEAITSSRILPGQSGEWWIAGPDGSIHLITADGQLFDSFNYGAPLTGLAACQLSNRPTLLVATSDGLAAWELQLPPKSKSAREY